jgi:hypothetical protein
MSFPVLSNNFYIKRFKLRPLNFCSLTKIQYATKLTYLGFLFIKDETYHSFFFVISERNEIIGGGLETFDAKYRQSLSLCT